MRFEQETSVYKDKEIQDRIDAAGGAATRYITEIGNGIRVHPENDAQNYLDIKDGLEIFRGGDSVAKYGETTRIGKADQNNIEISDSYISAGNSNCTAVTYGTLNDPETGLAELRVSGYAEEVAVINGTSKYGLVLTATEYITDIISCTANGTDVTVTLYDDHSFYGDTINEGDLVEAYYHSDDPAPFLEVGENSFARSPSSAAMGIQCQTSRTASQAFGAFTKARGYASLAEGSGSESCGQASHAEGTSRAFGAYAHSEGSGTEAHGSYSHAEGRDTKASGDASHAGGLGTSAVGDYQCVLGRYNVEDPNQAVIIGGGSTAASRKNILTIDWNGNVLCGLVNGIFLGLESISDWNTAYDSTKPLRFLKAWNASNAPESSANIVGIEFNINATNRTQFVFRTNSGAGRNGVFVRHCVGNTWDNWMTVSVS